jgi:dTDP-4-dehydrorhamnose reductase
MRILVVGSSGFLGQYFCEQFQGDQLFQLQRLAPESNQYALTSSVTSAIIHESKIQEVLLKAIKLAEPHVILNCIAITSSEKCEGNPEEAYFVNAEIPLILARFAKTFGAKLVQISTDAVFGQNGSKFSLHNLPSPKSVYGKSKLRGEVNVMRENNTNLIVRTNFYGCSARRTALFDYFYGRLKHGSQVVGFTNQIFSPLYVEDLVLNLMSVIIENVQGIIHMGGRQIFSKYDFGLEILKQLNLDSALIIPSEYQNSSERPYRNLDISLNSESSKKYIKSDSGLQFGISKAIRRARDSRYD